MKKITAVFAFVALMLGTIAAFATTPTVSHSKVMESWFYYNGGGENDPAHYSPAGGVPSCQQGSVLCAIKTSTNQSGLPIVPQTDPAKRKLKNQ